MDTAYTESTWKSNEGLDQRSFFLIHDYIKNLFLVQWSDFEMEQNISLEKMILTLLSFFLGSYLQYFFESGWELLVCKTSTIFQKP